MIKDIEFDTGLNGMFSGFCPSNGIAAELEKRAGEENFKRIKAIIALTNLKTGKPQKEWEEEKKQVRLLEAKIVKLQKELKQEIEIAQALGIGTEKNGLGAWCNDAVRRRNRAQETLNKAIEGANKINGELELLKKQQSEGLRDARKNHEVKLGEISDLNAEITRVKQLVTDYKVKRDNLKQQEAAKTLAEKQAQVQAEEKKLTNTRFARTIKENGFLIAGVTAVVGTLVFFSVKKNKTKKKNIKTVTV